MDTLTHIVLGACIGEAIAGKAIGKKAMLLGAIAQLLPDMDFIAHAWQDELDSILAHRGLTHSLLFVAIMTVIMGLLTKKKYKQVPVRVFFYLYGINMLVHLFIDSFNAYGTGWLEPFSDKRFSFHVLFVIDPFFSFWPFAGCLLLLLTKKSHRRRKWYWQSALALSAVYLLYASVNKLNVEENVRWNIADQNIDAQKYIITPTPFNSWLWYLIIKDEKGYYTGYRSVFDRQEKIPFQYLRRNDSLLKTATNKQEVYKLKKFAQGFYSLRNYHDTLVFSVLRFGQVIGWDDPKERFVFYYYMDRRGTNELVVQRSRFEKWNRRTLYSFTRRIIGN